MGRQLLAPRGRFQWVRRQNLSAALRHKIRFDPLFLLFHNYYRLYSSEGLAPFITAWIRFSRVRCSRRMDREPRMRERKRGLASPGPEAWRQAGRFETPPGDRPREQARTGFERVKRAGASPSFLRSISVCASLNLSPLFALKASMRPTSSVRCGRASIQRHSSLEQNKNLVKKKHSCAG